MAVRARVEDNKAVSLSVVGRGGEGTSGAKCHEPVERCEMVTVPRRPAQGPCLPGVPGTPGMLRDL
jgi:hypothetical protein